MSQDSGFPAAEAAIGELPLEVGVKVPTAGEKVHEIMNKMSAEEHVNPGVAAAAEAGE